MVDSSGSINDAHKDNWNLVRDFLVDLVDSFDVGSQSNRVALVTFSTRAQLRFGLDQIYDKDDLQTTLSELPYQGGKTNTPEGLRRAREDALGQEGANRPDVKDLIVLVTDGATTNAYKRYLDDEVEALKDTGAEIFGKPFFCCLFKTHVFMVTISTQYFGLLPFI